MKGAHTFADSPAKPKIHGEAARNAPAPMSYKLCTLIGKTRPDAELVVREEAVGDEPDPEHDRNHRRSRVLGELEDPRSCDQRNADDVVERRVKLAVGMKRMLYSFLGRVPS